MALGQAAPFCQFKIRRRTVEINQLKNFIGGIRNDRPDKHCQNAATLDQIVEHFIESVRLVLLLGLFERRGLLDILICTIDQPPDAYKSSLNLM